MIVIIGGNDDLRQTLADMVAPTISTDRVVRVASVSELFEVWSNRPTPDILHVVVHVTNDASDDEHRDHRATFKSLLARAELEGTPVSMLFERMQMSAVDGLPLGDLSIVFGTAVVDQAVEIRSAHDLTNALMTIAEHACARATTGLVHLDDGAEERGLVAVGTLFPVLENDYRAARLRALISARMDGFISGLREAYSQMEKWPLRAELPWDPTDSQSPAWSLNENGTWRVEKTTNSKPNLQDVMNVPSSEIFRSRLAGTEPKYDFNNNAWNDAWKGGVRLPPMLLLTGDSGTGKSLVAETLALLLAKRPRSASEPWDRLMPPFAKINSAGLTERTWEHIVHGATPGVWSGVHRAVVGQLSRAAHGVVFFDEIGDLPLPVQAGLLTFFDDRQIRPAGANPFPGFQHVIAATNRDLEEGTNQRWFRNDLLARFALRLRIPSLHERGKDELRQLIDFVMQDPSVNPKRKDERHAVCYITRQALERLTEHEYRDGNFRELTEVVHAAVRSAERRHSRLLELDDVIMPGDPRSRSDRDSHRVKVERIELPDETPRVTVADESDLRVLAHREGRAIMEDADHRTWVLPPTTAFTVDPPTAKKKPRGRPRA
jgi:energy-coupling factor transporter ATP-binding protein EcfA2